MKGGGGGVGLGRCGGRHLQLGNNLGSGATTTTQFTCCHIHTCIHIHSKANEAGTPRENVHVECCVKGLDTYFVALILGGYRPFKFERHAALTYAGQHRVAVSSVWSHRTRAREPRGRCPRAAWRVLLTTTARWCGERGTWAVKRRNAKSQVVHASLIAHRAHADDHRV